MTENKALALVDQAKHAMANCQYSLAVKLIKQSLEHPFITECPLLYKQGRKALKACQQLCILEFFRTVKCIDRIQARKKEQS